MNSMWLEPNKAWATDTVKTLRDASPGVPVVLVAPPDSEKPGSSKTDPRIASLVKQLAGIADEQKAAFWDLRAAMGGDGAFLEFMKHGLAATDRVHLSREGNILLGQRLLAALFDDVRARLAAHPTAGCAPP
jgi:lysophospholipase L1-like esterase